MSIRPLLTGQMALRRETGRDKYQQPIYEELGPFPCRVEETQKLIRSANGEQVIASAQVFAIDEVRLTDRIRWDGQDWCPILNISVIRRRDNTVSHYEVWTA